MGAALDMGLASLLDGTLSFDAKEGFGTETGEEVAIEVLLERLASWRDSGNRLNEWASYWNRGQQMRALDLGPIADLIAADGGGATDWRGMFEYAYHNRVLRDVWESNESLRNFDGAEHWRLVEEFKSLDLKRMELARAEVASAHYERIPRGGGGAGEVGLIRHEINKKRRHLPLRRLIERAGRAVQGIKPVFMMSPMSIAQYLAPGGLTFDLLLIDEASQVRPVEALGAVARARTMAVVGDKKQLPPTRFFDAMVNVDDEEDEEPQVADMESILGLCESSGLPSKMLRWHYRSRHESSLIAVSNRSFYDDRLFIVPSPVTDEGVGIGFRHLPKAVYDRGGSAANRGEAKAVAQAVLQHARRRPEKTLGVGAFSVSQRDAILDELELGRRPTRTSRRTSRRAALSRSS